MSKPRNIAARLSHTRIAGLAFSVVAAGIATACSVDRVSAPAATVPAQAITATVAGTLQSVTGLMWNTPIAQPISRSVTVTPRGGTLSIPETGLFVTIPANAVTETITITATALPGKLVAYDFQPHGTRFAATIKFKQDLTNTTWYGAANRGPVQGAYFANTSQVNTMTGSADVDEKIPAGITGTAVNFWISHFSGYMVAWGVN